ncbi:hypothetical protein QL285_080515 [Trifolium repens]|nr:hypothetical protein QL285_080515 [Trifolium repens]
MRQRRRRRLIVKRGIRAGQYVSGTQAILSSLHILSGTPFTGDFPTSKRGRDLGISSYRGSHLTPQNFTVNSGEVFFSFHFRPIYRKLLDYIPPIFSECLIKNKREGFI